MVVTLRHAVAAAAVLVVAAACADASTTFYSSDPNLGSARVVFQVTRELPLTVPRHCSYHCEICLMCPAYNSCQICDFYWSTRGETGRVILNSLPLLIGGEWLEDPGEDYGSVALEY